jgi:hypothetical protein
MFSHPFWRKINPTTIPTLFDFLLDHLLTIDLELGLGGYISRYINRRRQEFKVRFFSLYHTIPQRFKRLLRQESSKSE